MVVGKNEHLILRDFKRFKKIATDLGVFINFNQLDDVSGIFYITQKYLESLMQSSKMEGLIKKSYFIIDEYDWLIFDGNSQ